MFSQIVFLYHLLKFSRDPQNTVGVFRFTDALIKRASQKERDDLSDELLADPDGASLYASPNKDYLYRPFDLTELRRCRPGTLGERYAAMMDAKGLNPEFFEYIKVIDPASFFILRLRKTHDLYHLITGFDTTVPGEIGLQGFYIAQLHTAVPLSIAVSGLLHVVSRRDPAMIKTAMQDFVSGYQSGLAAAKFHGVRWEDLWHTDLELVRAKLLRLERRAQPKAA